MPSVLLLPETRGPLIGGVGLVLFLPQLLPLVSEEAARWDFFVGITVLISWGLGLLGMGLTFVGGIVALDELRVAAAKPDAQLKPLINLLNLVGCLCPILAISTFALAFFAVVSSVSRWN